MSNESSADEVRDEVHLARTASSARAARTFISDFLVKADRRDLIAAAKLCASELVTNVIRHTEADGCTLAARMDGDVVVLNVSDDSDEDPSVEREEPKFSEHGRGLRIIDALANEWGVSRSSETQKSVWLRLK